VASVSSPLHEAEELVLREEFGVELVKSRILAEFALQFSNIPVALGLEDPRLALVLKGRRTIYLPVESRECVLRK